MARVRQWLPGFLKRHKAKFNPHDWPDGSDSEDAASFLEGWITAFATREVTEAEADEASVALVLTPPNFRREHVPMVVAQIETIRKRRGVQPGTGTREFAVVASVGCPYCGGQGLASAWAEEPSNERKIPESVAAYCVCPHGRWIKRTHAEKNPELLRGIPDFGEVLDGLKRGWLAHPPGRPGMQAQESADIGEPVPSVSKAQINAMFGMPGRG